MSTSKMLSTFFETGSFLGLKFSNLAGLAGQRASGSSCLLFPHWDHRPMHHHSMHFYVSFEDHTQDIMLVRATTLPTELSTQPLFLSHSYKHFPFFNFRIT